MRFRIALALITGAAAFAVSSQAGVPDWGRATFCKASSLAENIQNLTGFEILFGTVLTKVDPELRQSALLALGQPTCRHSPGSRRAAGTAISNSRSRPASLRAPKCPGNWLSAGSIA